MAKARLCKKCGTEVIEISPPGIIKTEGIVNPGWSMVEGPEVETEDGYKYAPTEMTGGMDDKAEWKGQYQCPKCDPGGENYFNVDYTELKNIEGMTREQEIELSKKAKESIEKESGSSVIWNDGPEPGKGWND